jgi:hypothetical protein
VTNLWHNDLLSNLLHPYAAGIAVVKHRSAASAKEKPNRQVKKILASPVNEKRESVIPNTVRDLPSTKEFIG